MSGANFDQLRVREEWCFKNVRSIEQWTHGYHRYPAKFLPNIVKKLIEDYALNNGIIADLFAGCGTTMVEAKVHGVESIGTDINPVAQLVAQVKTKPISPDILENAFKGLIATYNFYNPNTYNDIQTHSRIDYWFRAEEKKKVAFLYEQILLVENDTIKKFFLVCLSHILKNCSKWLQSSTKPQIDPNKIPADPFVMFQSHCDKMILKNELYYKELLLKNFLDTNCEIRLEDARNTSIKSNSIGTIITSPPYVTSYEYADIHQLTGYWFDYFNDLKVFRKKFIGTFYSENKKLETSSILGQKIIEKIYKKDSRTAYEVSNYFTDMEAVAKEMYRILRNDGYACIVIGNTTFKDIKIKSAEVFYEILRSVGFEKKKVIKRSIPNKLMPTIRDKKTGRFTSLDNRNSKLIYPEEYIIIVKK